MNFPNSVGQGARAVYLCSYLGDCRGMLSAARRLQYCSLREGLCEFLIWGSLDCENLCKACSEFKTVYILINEAVKVGQVFANKMAVKLSRKEF